MNLHDAPERRREIRDTDDRVWDMVGSLVHPAALYVVLQLLIADRFSTVEPWKSSGPLSTAGLALYGTQFLGAWAVFYTTLLRDMGLRSRGGTVLLAVALLTVGIQYFLPQPENMPTWVAVALPGVQGLLGTLIFFMTWARWRREKRSFEKRMAESLQEPQPQSPQPPSPRASAALIAAAGWFPQQARGEGADVSAANDDFFSWTSWLLVLVPALVVFLLAARKRKATPELPHTADFTWAVDVAEARVPVIIHAYHAWSIGDHVIESQVQKLQVALQGRARIYWLDLDKNPVTIGQFPTLCEKSVALFRDGKLLWQSTGVQDAGTILQELEQLRLLPPAG